MSGTTRHRGALLGAAYRDADWRRHLAAQRQLELEPLAVPDRVDFLPLEGRAAHLLFWPVVVKQDEAHIRVGAARGVGVGHPDGGDRVENEVARLLVRVRVRVRG